MQYLQHELLVFLDRLDATLDHHKALQAGTAGARIPSRTPHARTHSTLSAVHEVNMPGRLDLTAGSVTKNT